MKNPPAFQFYAADFLVGVIEMSDEEVGIYIRMLSFQWIHGSLPSDAKLIKKCVNSTRKPSENVMRKFVICDDGRIRNTRLESEREKQIRFRESRVKGAEAKWKAKAEADACASKVHINNACKTDALCISSSSSERVSGARGEDSGIPTVDEVAAFGGGMPGIPRGYCEHYHERRSVGRTWFNRHGILIDWKRDIVSRQWWGRDKDTWVQVNGKPKAKDLPTYEEVTAGVGLGKPLDD